MRTSSACRMTRFWASRAFVTDPGMLLMDEPLAALDAQNRVILQAELVRIMPPESRQPHELQGGLDPRRRFAGGNAARHEAEADIGFDAHPGKQAALLEHHGVLDRPARRLDLDRAAGLGGEPRKDAQQRRFPTP